VAKIRILVVDDSVIFRRALAEELGRDPDLEVVATAPNGRIALTRLEQVRPDVVILDVEMPEMDGLEVLKAVRKTHPNLPVVMFSALTRRGAAATLDALAAGATDYFTKPADSSGPDASLRVVREEMVPEIKALCARPASRAEPTFPPAPNRPAPDGAVRAVVIGVSTGGPNALAEVFARLPADFPVPILIVQHMPAMFLRLLAERLTAGSPIRVEVGESGTVIGPGRAWIAPGERHMGVVREGTNYRLIVHEEPPENSCRPAADVLLRSAVKAYGSDVLAVILTGMGRDGLRGCEAVREAGGRVIAQDQDTSVVWGMPGEVARAGLADKILPLPQIAEEIVRRVRAGRR
jgi:two-component system chemotaxis response regulator CheB